MYEKIDRPALIVHGSADRLVPVADSIAPFREAFTRIGNVRVDFKTFGGAEHGIQDGPHLRPAYLDWTASWAAAHFADGDGRRPRVLNDTSPPPP